ncbi:MAG: hypothetical protein OXI77_14300 [Chloroflexota bacterium]|nr:hypothetical protein [Chloroflexota bacterium]MDE2910659.1 hypothetical protein [Chloroflexota bacterium]
MDWANVLENALPIFTICGVFFLWLRQDNKRLEDKIEGQITQLRNEMIKQDDQLRNDMTAQNEQLRKEMASQNDQLRKEMTSQNEQLRKEMNDRFDAMEARLRGVETEQARVAGLLEGLALTGRLPEREDALD